MDANARSVKVRIENSYTDGHESEKVVTLPAPGGDLIEWWEDEVFQETGDGHYTEVYDATGERLGSCYIGTIIEADDKSLVGEYYEWLD